MTQEILSEDTLITVGTAIAVLMAATGLAWKLSKLFGDLNSTMKGLRKDVAGLTTAIDDRIEHKDVVNWIRLFRAKNPGLDIPHFPEKE